MNTEILKHCNDNAKISVKEVCRITGITRGGLYCRIYRGEFPAPDSHSTRLGLVPGKRRLDRVYWSAKTLKRIAGL